MIVFLISTSETRGDWRQEHSKTLHAAYGKASRLLIIGVIANTGPAHARVYVSEPT